MIKSSMICILLNVCLLWRLYAQDALISPYQTFEIHLNEHTTHQTYLIEIQTQRYNQQWSAMFLYLSHQNNRPIIEAEFKVILKQQPEQKGVTIKKCRIDENSHPYCKIDTYGINFHYYLFKMQLDCLGKCPSNITIGFTRSSWQANQLPQLIQGALPTKVDDMQSERLYNRRIILAKILGWMLLTLILVLGAIKFAVKVADWVDDKADPKQRQRLKQQRQRQQQQDRKDREWLQKKNKQKELEIQKKKKKD